MQQAGNKQRIINLGDLIEGLSEAGIEFIIVGGLAAVIQGAPITTIDLDIVHHQKKDNILKLLNFLKQIDAHYRRPDDKIIEPEEQDIAAKGHVLLSTNFGPLDVLAFIENGYSYQDILPNSVEIEFRGYKIRVLELETLIELKRHSMDSKDLFRLSVLEETLRQKEQ
jgi:predicted nucleotidyltransferase